MDTFKMIRLVLLLLVASCAASDGSVNAVNDNMKMLEELEDLIHRDGNIQAYLGNAQDAQQWHGRSPESLLRQFNSASRSPAAIRRLTKFRSMLLMENTPLSSRLSEDALNELISEMDDVLGTSVLQTNCEDSMCFRTFDGSCNNLGHSERGAVETPLMRKMTNAYNDGLSSPRTKSVNGGDLPSARAVSLAAFDGNTEQTVDYTSLGVHLGQITDHDLSAVEGQSGVTCSGCAVGNECLAIKIDASDPVFGSVKSCFEFTRAHHEMDSAGIRQQVNSITTWLDASFVYGSSDTVADTLNDECGFMEHMTDSETGRDLLPPNKELTDCVGLDAEANIFCGLAGDGRVAEQPGLTSLHTLFLREHNRIVRELRSQKPTISAVDAYQIARKIVGAQWQHILYNEYLPQITGETLYNSKNLGPSAPYQYDPDVDASIANIFAAAGFRFGHTEIPNELIRAEKNYNVDNIPVIQMSEAFFNATYIFDASISDGALDSILRGMMVQELDIVDKHLASSLTDNLFGTPNEAGDGFDLAALNIQRGRDHGLPSYAVIRETFCGSDTINDYSDLVHIADTNIAKLKDAYGDNGVRDIDAFVGLIIERHLTNALVGPTLACIFADQFNRLKFGDRFFYKNPQHLTPAEMTEIEKSTFARLMCDNVEGVNEVQPCAFVADKNFQTRSKRYESFYEYSKSGDWPHQRASTLDGLDNRRTNCGQSTIPEVDLSVFVPN